MHVGPSGHAALMTKPLLVLLFGLMITSCADEGQLGADALWQIRCPRGTAGCTTPGEAANVIAYTGTMGATVTCSVSELGNGDRLFNASIRANTTQRLQIQNLPITESGVVAGTSGIVVVEDEGNTFRANVGSSTPNETTACQIASIAPVDREEGPSAYFQLLCRGIFNPANPDRTRRDLAYPNDSDRPAEITIFNCPGF